MPRRAGRRKPGGHSGAAARRRRRQATLEEAQIAISEQVQFETGTALIRDDSSALLQQVVEVLQRHREIESCEVGGHTDDTGTAELNRELSEARARAVMAWLVARGVEARRLTARGYGSSRPIADNAHRRQAEPATAASSS